MNTSSSASLNTPLHTPINPLAQVQLDTALPDGEARYQAIHPQGSFIVQAPAGSGKTALLTQRFLALLSQVETPEQIVAMTFTKKAAAEMRERIFEALADGQKPLPENASLYDHNTWQLAQAALQNAAQRGWQLLDNPNRLRIRTIDSMNGYLVQQMPLLSRLGTQPQMASSPETLYLHAARQALKDSQTSEAVASLLRLVNGSFRTAENLLVGMLAKRDQWMGALLQYGSEDEAAERAELENALALLVAQEQQQAVQRLSPGLGKLQALCDYAEFAAGNDQPQLQHLAGVVLSPETDLSVWRTLGDWILTKSDPACRKTVNKAQGFPAGKGENKANKDGFLEALSDFALADLRGDMAQALHELRQLPDGHYNDAQWQSLRHLIALLRRAVAHLKLAFQQQGEADFIEVAQAASQALGTELEPTDLAERLDYTLKHLLIDEFQDTSVAQYELVKKLVAGWTAEDDHSLFIVGDPMQSIYRFREAEVGNFLQAWQGRLGQVALTPLSLTVNFRSTQGVVDWVNQTFAEVFPKHSIIEQGAVCYSPATAFSDNAEPAVRAEWALERSAGEEADAAVDIIQTTLPDLKPGAAIGVLGRSRSHLMPIAVRLKQAGIRFRALELEGLKERQEIQDCEALTRALLHLGDRPAWIALLRSPLVGLSLADLYALLGENDDYYQTPVWQSLQAAVSDQNSHTLKGIKAWSKLSKPGQARLAQAGPVLDKALKSMGSFRLEQVVRQAWLELDGAQTVESELALQNVEAFWMMLNALQMQNDAQALTAAGLADTLEKLFALPDASPKSGRVELMTMHKSKGLEFDTVILPGLGRKPRSDDNTLLSWLSFKGTDGDDNRLVIAPFEQKGKAAQASNSPGLVNLIKRTDSVKQDYELGRLFYVAATRAKRRLHLLGSVTVSAKQLDGDQPLAPPAKSLLNCLWPQVQAEFETLLTNYAPSEEAIEECAIIPKVSRLPLMRTGFASSAVAMPDWLKRGATEPLMQDDEAGDDELSLAAGNVASNAAAERMNWQTALLAKSVGNFVHKMLEIWVAQGVPTELELISYDALYRHQLLQDGLNGELLETAMARVMHSLQNAVHNESLIWALNPSHAESAVELALSSISEVGQANHIVDRTFVDDQGVRWIVDYKTSWLEAAASEADRKMFIEEQVAVYRPQLARYGDLFKAMEERPQKWILYFTALDAWVEVKPEE
jgi:ATP-dependent exoDNAse (exonuclease V) beta subunit